jgi:hypothetical protein
VTAIPLLDIDLKKLKLGTQRDNCTPTLTAGLFTIANIWKLPKFPLINGCIKKMW